MSKKQEMPESQTNNNEQKVAKEVIENNAADPEGTAVNEEEFACANEQQAETPEEIIAQLQQQLEQEKLKAGQNWDKAVRAVAEMENLKKRTQKDLENAHKFALEKFTKELVQVVDSLELGIQASTGDNPEVVKLREGSELTLKQLASVFSKFNIEVVDPLGQPFNPEHHQAMSMQPTADFLPNTVMNVFQKGYLLNSRLLRPAMVIVAKAMEDNPKINEQA